MEAPATVGSTKPLCWLLLVWHHGFSSFGSIVLHLILLMILVQQNIFSLHLLCLSVVYFGGHSFTILPAGHSLL